LKTKRHLLQLCLLGAVLLLPGVVQAQLTFTTNNGAITITGYTGNPTNLNIPSITNGYPVTSIKVGAFAGRTSLTNVTIPDSVTNIGSSAFNSCNKLINLTLGNAITSIGDEAFARCSSLHSVTLPDSVINLGIGAFDLCYNLQSINIPNGVISIGGYTFEACNLTNITIPTSVTRIGEWAFFECTNLTSLAIPNSVTNIGDDAIRWCFKLAEVSLGDGVTSIGNLAFGQCTGLTNIMLGKAVSSIGSHAFDTCTNLTGITIPDSLTTIGDYAFNGCTSLANIIIPQSVNAIGTLAFLGCSSLTNFTVDAQNTIYSSLNEALLDKSQTTLIEYLGRMNGGFVVPDGVTSIGDYAFYQCSSLTNITIPKSVTWLGVSAFGSCDNLTSVYFDGDAPLAFSYPFFPDVMTVYYFPGTTGWSQFLVRVSAPGFPILGAFRMLPYPVILTGDTSFGVQTNEFVFTIAWATNLAVVVEASTNLSNPVWQPVQTNTLTSGMAYFSDPQWTNYPSRFYRLRSP
jgi:hypothetical protein